MRQNQHVEVIVDDEAQMVTLNFKGLQPLTFDPKKAHAANRLRAELRGWAQQRLIDKAAISRTDEDGNIIPDDERLETKRTRIQELIEHYESGSETWNLTSGGGGAKSITIEAIARVKSVTYAEAEKYVDDFAAKTHKLPDGKTVTFKDRKEALAYLGTGKRVQEAKAAIRAERTPAAKVDADKALEELGQSK